MKRQMKIFCVRQCNSKYSFIFSLLKAFYLVLRTMREKESIYLMRLIWLIRFHKPHTIFRRWFVSTKNKLFAFSRSEIHNLECKPDQYKWLHLLWQYNNDFKNFLISFSIDCVIIGKDMSLMENIKRPQSSIPQKWKVWMSRLIWLRNLPDIKMLRWNA